MTPNQRSAMEWHRWGCRIGRWHVTWWDLWKKRPAFEVVREKDRR
jgi:hypothetical protein